MKYNDKVSSSYDLETEKLEHMGEELKDSKDKIIGGEKKSSKQKKEKAARLEAEISKNSTSDVSLKTKERLKNENKVLRISMAGSILFLLSECLIAFLTHSQAVLMDCIYDIVDMAMLIPFMLLVPKLYKPVTEKWPYGVAQVESLFVIIKCGLLLFLDVQLAIDSIGMIIDGGHLINATIVATFELCISATCLIMYFVLKHLNKVVSSPTIKAELYIWKLDSYSTAGVGLAFIFQIIIQRTSFAYIAPYIDPAIALFMAVILMKDPIIMLRDSFKSLILAAPKEEVLDHVRDVVSEPLKKYHIKVNFLDMIKTGRKFWIDIYFSPEGDSINMEDLRTAHAEIKAALDKEYENLTIEFVPDIK